MFRDGYNQLRNNIKNKIDKEFIYGTWKDMSEFKVIIENNIKSIFESLLSSSCCSIQTLLHLSL